MGDIDFDVLDYNYTVVGVFELAEGQYTERVNRFNDVNFR